MRPTGGVEARTVSLFIFKTEKRETLIMDFCGD